MWGSAGQKLQEMLRSVSTLDERPTVTRSRKAISLERSLYNTLQLYRKFENGCPKNVIIIEFQINQSHSTNPKYPSLADLLLPNQLSVMYLIAKPTFITVVLGWLENTWRDFSPLQLESKEWE